MSDTHEIRGGATTNPDPESRSTFYVMTLGIIIVVLTVILLEILFYRSTESEFTRKDLAAGFPELEELRESEERLVREYRWIDRKAGVVAVPVSRAIELLAEEAAAAEPTGSQP
jgi:hypothetical protein